MQEKQIALLGGDERYIEVARAFARHGATIYVCGFSDISFTEKTIVHAPLSSIPFQTLDAIILPVLGTDDSGNIATHFPSGHITLHEEILQQTKTTCTIFSGLANDHLKNMCNRSKRTLIAYYELDEVAILNAVPTAEATLQIAMEETDFTIHGATTLVTGFGRIGTTMAKLFHNVGANVFVTGRDSAQLARAETFGMTTVPIEQLHTVIASCDICINTIPALVMTEPLLNEIKEGAIIIDVASRPGGVDFHAAERLKIKAIHALGLPGKVAPKSAGAIIAKTIQHYIDTV